MSNELAQQLFEAGRGHALSADLLYRSAIKDAESRNLRDPIDFAFNGTFSLSTHYLLGLGLELMLKSVIVLKDPNTTEKALREIGHDLVVALNAAEATGFRSAAPNLRSLLELLNEPFKQHWFRYSRPDQFALPGDFGEVLQILNILDSELRLLHWGDN